MSIRPLAVLALASIAFASAACSDDPTDPATDGRNLLNVLLTDAPGDVAAVWVEIERIYLQGGDGPVELLDEPTELIELTELVGTAVPLVEDLTDQLMAGHGPTIHHRS